MINRIIERSFKVSKARGHNKMYIAVDIHETMVTSNYIKGNISTEFYKGAKETLQYLSKRKDVVLIMFTCSYQEEIEKYLEYFEFCGIDFKYCNENPEVKTGDDNHGNYDKKFYFNILLDDKAGFNVEEDWDIIYNTFLKYEELN